MTELPDKLKGYITVAERIEAFIAKYPEGSLQARIVELTEDRVVMEASAYRDREDQRPGIGYSSMPIPARNIMLRDSEIETCETSAWGRAIAALGFEVRKGVASRNEIEAKSGQPNIRDEITTDGGLIGTAEKGTARTSDYLLRETSEGWFLGFRLKGGGRKGGFLVEAHDAMAQALALVEADVIDQRCQVWGHWVERKLTKGSYQAFYLEHIITPTIELPAPDGTGQTVAASDPSAASGDHDDVLPTDAAGTSSQEPPQNPGSLPSAESGAEELLPEKELAQPMVAAVAGGTGASPAVVLCGNRGSLDTVCTLEKGHFGRHKELATDGRVLASW